MKIFVGRYFNKTSFCFGAALSMALGASLPANSADLNKKPIVDLPREYVFGPRISEAPLPNLRALLSMYDGSIYRGLDEGGVQFNEVQYQPDPSMSRRDDDCNEMKGNPINYATGEKIESELDFADSSGEMPLYLSRTYSPRARSGGFGANWSSSLEDRYLVDNFYSLSLGRPGGSYRTFLWFGGNNYYDSPSPPQNPAAHVVDYIKKNADGTFTYYASDYSTELYSAAGQVLEVKSPQGVKWTFTYASPSGLLQRVTHASGKYIQLNWTYSGTPPYGGPQITSVVDPGGNVYSYTYSYNGMAGNMLSSAVLPGVPGTTISYHYDHVGPVGMPLLTGKSFNGQRYSYFQYLNVLGNNNALATSTYHVGNVEKYSFSYTYDADGWITKSVETNPLGQLVEHNFENAKEVSTSVQQTAHCGGGVSHRTYGLDGNLETSTDFNGNVTKYSYSEFGQLLEKIEAFGTPIARRTVYEWAQNSNRLLKVTVIGLVRIEYVYGAKNRLISTTTTNLSSNGVSGGTHTTTYAYTEHPNGMLASIVVDGPLVGAGDVVTYSFDNQGNLLSQQNSLGHLVQYQSYNGMGQPGRVVGVNGSTTDYTYDARGRVTKARQYIGTTSADTDYTYNAEGLLYSVTTPDGVATTYTYDAARRLTSEKRNAAGVLIAGATYEEKRYGYDQASNVTSVQTLADGVSKSIAYVDYDEQSRVIAKRGNNGQNFRYTYDANGNLAATIDSTNKVTTLAYDALNRVVTQTDPLNAVTRFEYDPGNQTTKVTDPKGLNTTYVYDGFGQMWAQYSPDSGATSFQLSADGLLSAVTRNDGSVLSYEYDNLGRMTRYGTPTDSRGYSYDSCQNGKGFLCSASTSAGAHMYLYTPLGQIQGELEYTPNSSDYTGYVYDAMGRTTGISYPSGVSVGYGFTGGKLAAMTATVGGTTSIVANALSYLPYGPIAGWNYGNGLTRNYYYDDNYVAGDLRLTGITTMNGGTALQNLLMQYDSNNRINGITNFVDAANSQSFGYDSVGRLASAATAGNTMSLGYDGTGNRTSRLDSSTGVSVSYGYPSTSHQLQNATSSNGLLNRSFFHNALGDVTSWNDATGYSNSLVYDAFQRPKSHSRNGVTTDYRFNALDQRVGKNSAIANARYTYSGQNTLTAEYSSGSWTSYLWLGSQPVGLIKSNSLYWVGADHLGRPELVTNSSKQVVWRAKNQAFDRSVVTDQVGGYSLGFPGQYFDVESNLWYNGYRDYEPTLGRFLQSDPIGLAGGVSTYGYVGGNPITNIDPLGLDDVSLVLYGSGVIAKMPERRGPDYISVSGNIGVANFNYTLTRNGTLFSGGGFVGNPASPRGSLRGKPGISLVAGYMDGCPKTGKEVDGFVNGLTTTYGYMNGIGISRSSNDSGRAINVGIGTPSIGMDVTYVGPVGNVGSGWRP